MKFLKFSFFIVIFCKFQVNSEIVQTIDQSSQTNYLTVGEKGAHNSGFEVDTEAKPFSHYVQTPDGVRLGCYGYQLGEKKYSTVYVSDARGYRIIPTFLDVVPVYPVGGEVRNASFESVFNAEEKLSQNIRLFFPDICRAINVSPPTVINTPPPIPVTRPPPTPPPACPNGGVPPDCCSNGGRGKYCCTNGANNQDCCTNGGRGKYCCTNGANNQDCCTNGGQGQYCCTNGANNPDCSIPIRPPSPPPPTQPPTPRPTPPPVRFDNCPPVTVDNTCKKGVSLLLSGLVPNCVTLAVNLPLGSLTQADLNRLNDQEIITKVLSILSPY